VFINIPPVYLKHWIALQTKLNQSQARIMFGFFVKHCNKQPKRKAKQNIKTSLYSHTSEALVFDLKMQE
jgi:hypothetical protein